MFKLKMKYGSAALALGLIVVSATAQNATTEKSALTAKSQDNLKVLASLSSLPEGEWRFHSGDLPHGEAVDLDDSGWQNR